MRSSELCGTKSDARPFLDRGMYVDFFDRSRNQRAATILRLMGNLRLERACASVPRLVVPSVWYGDCVTVFSSSQMRVACEGRCLSGKRPVVALTPHVFEDFQGEREFWRLSAVTQTDDALRVTPHGAAQLPSLLRYRQHS